MNNKLQVKVEADRQMNVLKKEAVPFYLDQIAGYVGKKIATLNGFSSKYPIKRFDKVPTRENGLFTTFSTYVGVKHGHLVASLRVCVSSGIVEYYDVDVWLGDVNNLVLTSIETLETALGTVKDYTEADIRELVAEYKRKQKEADEALGAIPYYFKKEMNLY